jgi:hypothetical protein
MGQLNYTSQGAGLPCLRFYYKLGYFQNDENAFFLKINISL